MKKIFITFAVLLVCASFIPYKAHAEFKKTKIAVIDFQIQGEGFETTDMGKIVAEWLITAFVQEGRFEVVERSLLEKVLGEQKLVMTGVVDPNSATELGKLLGVKVIISGSVMKFQNILEVNARIIDVKDASIIAAESVKSSTAIRLEDLVVQMSRQIIKDFPLEGYIVHTDGNKVTIDLGKRAGVKPGMKFVIYKEGRVIKHPKTGEVLDVEKVQTGIVEITEVRDKIAQGKIIESTATSPIGYGQMVISLIKPVEPLDDTGYADVNPVAPPSRQSPPISVSGDISPTEARYVSMLQSTNIRNKLYGAKKIFRLQTRNMAILDVVEQELLNGFQITPDDRHQADLMAWLCNILGASKNIKYKRTLQQVLEQSRNKKIKGFAKKNYRMLK